MLKLDEGGKFIGWEDVVSWDVGKIRVVLWKHEPLALELLNANVILFVSVVSCIQYTMNCVHGLLFAVVRWQSILPIDYWGPFYQQSLANKSTSSGQVIAFM